jgi:hypothetical protein
VLTGTLCCTFLHIHADVVSQERACEAGFDEVQELHLSVQATTTVQSGRKSEFRLQQLA